jgi:hypothetical protein
MHLEAQSKAFWTDGIWKRGVMDIESGDSPKRRSAAHLDSDGRGDGVAQSEYDWLGRHCGCRIVGIWRGSSSEWHVRAYIYAFDSIGQLLGEAGRNGQGDLHSILFAHSTLRRFLPDLSSNTILKMAPCVAEIVEKK